MKKEEEEKKKNTTKGSEGAALEAGLGLGVVRPFSVLSTKELQPETSDGLDEVSRQETNQFRFHDRLDSHIAGDGAKEISKSHSGCNGHEPQLCCPIV